MKKNNPLLVLLLLVFMFLANYHTAYAFLSLASGFFTEKGKQFYKEGKEDDAIKEFSKAIQSDPTNEEARKYLEKMGVSSAVYDLPESNQVKLAKLAQESKVYQDKLNDTEKVYKAERAKANQLAAEKQQLCDILELKNEEVDILNIRTGLLKDSLAKSGERYQKRLNHFKSLSEVQNEELGFLERMLHQHKYLVEQKENQLTQKDRTIREFDDKLVLVKNISEQEIFKTEDQRFKEQAEYQQTITDLREDIAMLKKMPETPVARAELEEKIRLIKEKDEDMTRLKEKLLAAREHIRELEEMTKGAADTKRLEELKQRIEQIQEELNQKNISLEAQESDIGLLEARLSDAQEQLGFVQAMVDEKESQIQALEDELKEIRQRCQ